MKVPANLNSQTSLSQEAKDQITDLKDQLQKLEALYLLHATHAQHSNFEDSLGENLCLAQLCSNVVASVKNYEEFLDNIDKPGFLISSIIPKKNIFHLCKVGLVIVLKPLFVGEDMKF
ncbi:hypothetical protein [Candidatus Odyssella acanthamoebae]|uniref:Uncharacterized protein n=1 Tax=Candidatus Odyssella acanthamoebae TaxID=91604 RepID=A0A077ARQ0_9PROT|nr:hypothetical protein [Candidatus Paracaedibacter acanthamoebae]AIK95872.1 hypothetical protein ID47_02660 [Candidatus Paracaedibacter acanthamoebae]